MDISHILALLTVHFVADFMLQSGGMATNKSSSNEALSGHVFIYSLVWLIAIPLLAGIGNTGQEVGNWILFTVITFVCHWITDYFTSRVVKQKFEEKEYYTPVPNLGAFSIIGLDQLLHYFQLIITYKILFL